MKSLIAHLGGQDFPRVRVGVGKPVAGQNLVDFVLGVPSKENMQLLEKSLEAAAEAAEIIVKGRMDDAMQFANTFQP